MFISSNLIPPSLQTPTASMMNNYNWNEDFSQGWPNLSMWACGLALTGAELQDSYMERKLRRKPLSNTSGGHSLKSRQTFLYTVLVLFQLARTKNVLFSFTWPWCTKKLKCKTEIKMYKNIQIYKKHKVLKMTKTHNKCTKTWKIKKLKLIQN